MSEMGMGSYADKIIRSMGGPISPSQVTEVQEKTFPIEVWDSFNELIAEKWNGREAKVLQKDVVARIMSKCGIDRNVVFDKGYLNVEPAYREKGWKVFYDKPVSWAGESGDAHFKFSKA